MVFRFGRKKTINSYIKVLSIKEECKLTEKEKQLYNKQLREFLLNRKLQVTTKGALTIAPKLKKATEKIVKCVTPILAGGKVNKIVSGIENIPEGPVIFACNHQGMLDNFVWIPECPKHALIVHGADTNKLLLLVQLNTGLIMVERGKSAAKKREFAKLDMMSILLRRHSIFIYPESTWNLSPNKIHLPINWGFIDVAAKTEAPIVPVAINYTYDTNSKRKKITSIEVEYGKAIYVNRNDSIEEKIYEYSESIATMFWDMLEKQNIVKREHIENSEYINYIKNALKEFKIAKKDIKCERNEIYGAKDGFYEFHHINDVPFDDGGNLLETDECTRLREINALHGI